MFHPFTIEHVTDLPLAFEIMRRCFRKHDSLRIIKTWVNAWSTSTRFHNATILPCLFGCQDGQDRLSHYVMCPCLYTTIHKLRDTSPCPPTRLGLISPCRESLLTVACIFSGYHGLKMSDFARALSPSPLNSVQQSAALLLFADAFRVAALEVGLDTKTGTNDHLVLEDSR